MALRYNDDWTLIAQPLPRWKDSTKLSVEAATLLRKNVADADQSFIRGNWSNND
jgi:hypothetical protein